MLIELLNKKKTFFFFLVYSQRIKKYLKSDISNYWTTIVKKLFIKRLYDI